MILKSYIIEKNINELAKFRSALLYGENDGIKDDVKTKLKLLHKDSEIINLFQEEIIKNKNCLFDNVNNSSLFNEKKTIFIQEASDKILDEINEVLEKNHETIKIYIFSSLLDKKSKLRSLFDKEKNLASLPCYQDTDRTLIFYVNDKLKDFKGISQEIVNLIISNSNHDRKVIKNEIDKIKSCFMDKNIKKKELEELLNIKVNNNFDTLRDSALLGDLKSFDKSLKESEFLPEDSFFNINSLSYRITKLIEIQRINKQINNLERSIEEIKPKIFWKDKPVIMQQCKKWDLKNLLQISTDLASIEILMKKNSYMKNDILIKKFLLNVFNKAASF